MSLQMLVCVLALQEGENAIARTACLVCPSSQTQLTTEVMALARYMYFDFTNRHTGRSIDLNILYRFRHNNLVQLMGFSKSPPCVVYEYMQHGSLYHNIHEVFPRNQVLKFDV